ncbi:exostosin-like 2 isoform X2 [Engraulis encrasicolus]|uniref:exostosin-like 2 isoform X2 n=1 Tax=Engraulis encrasicolus TaxID=184585 RepID=UPI002FD2A36D
MSAKTYCGLRWFLRRCRTRLARKSSLILFALLLALFWASLYVSTLQAVDTDYDGVGLISALHHPRLERFVHPEDSFTIVMETYKRTDILLKLLRHYQLVPRLKQIVVVWNNVGERPPSQMWESGAGPHRVPVFFKEQTRNLVRNRMLPFPEIDTEAVLMLDDDLLISVPDITFAFSVWKRFSDQIVGFVPRKHETRTSGAYKYSVKAGGDFSSYSMVLVGAAFFHRRYLQVFQDQPRQVHALVDKTQNCDDIAMNFAVALWLAEQDGWKARPSGVLVKPAVAMQNLEEQARSGFMGLWRRPFHKRQRSYCLNRLSKIYGDMPLLYSKLIITR